MSSTFWPYLSFVLTFPLHFCTNSPFLPTRSVYCSLNSLESSDLHTFVHMLLDFSTAILILNSPQDPLKVFAFTNFSSLLSHKLFLLFFPNLVSLKFPVLKTHNLYYLLIHFGFTHPCTVSKFYD